MTGNKPSTQAFDGEMAEILESFIIETREIMDKLGQDMLALEKGTTDPDLLNRIFRAVHTIKGTSSFLGLDQMTELAHRFEDVLNKMRRGDLAVSSDKMDVMFEASDLLKILLQRIEERNGEHVDLHAILEKLSVVNNGGQAKGAKGPAEAPPGQAPVTPSGPPVSAAEPSSPGGGPERDTASAASPASGAGPKSADTTIRVDVGRLDSLMNLVGELVLGRNRLAQITSQLNQEQDGVRISRELAETSSQIDFITTELQMAVMKTRMVPIAKIFNRLPRLIRDLMKETGKDIDLVVSGEETELDKSIIEELNDPLIHILRNAADHGIEPTADRVAAGKPPRGTVTVKAEQEGNHIAVTISDDGRGMDPERLKAKAIEKQLINEQQAREMTGRDALQLIFAPGFSTAAKVTNVSGRGVGMDVVRTNITRLKGIVEIESEPGKGSSFHLKLPLTLAIIQALLVEVSKEIYSIPLGSVLEVVRVKPSEINTIRGREVVRLRDAVLPIGRLTAVMGSAGNGTPTDWLYIVVLGLAQQRLGIVVDTLFGQKEVVIKSLGAYLGTVPGIAGSTILGDGRVVMIVDVGELMKLYAGRP